VHLVRCSLTIPATAVFLLFARVPPCLAQAVQGRVLQLPAGMPVAGALVVLVDSAGRDVARAATSASGGYTLAAGSSGSYRIVVRQIGWQAWTSPTFELAPGATHPLLLRIEAEPYTLPTITVEARRPRCGIRLGGDAVVSRLLEVAQTALALAQTTADDGAIGFSSEWYLARYTPALELEDSSSLGVGRLGRWPVQSALPDTLERWGFVRTDGPDQDWTDVGSARGPVYYGLDARALFSDWFLASHCFRVEEDEGGELRVRFEPSRRRGRADVAGMVVLDRASLELRRIEFAYVNLPGWIPRERAGGEVKLRRLHSGAWVPYAWRVRAPVPRLVVGRTQPKVDAWVETGGWVRSVRGPAGQVDTAMTREVLGR
jgi:carboxypeptidase family protein